MELLDVVGPFAADAVALLKQLGGADREIRCVRGEVLAHAAYGQ